MKRFLTAAKSNDYEVIKRCFSRAQSGEFDNVMAGFIGQQFKRGKVGKSNIRGNRATVHVIGVKDLFSSTWADFRFKLVKETGRWKIDDFNLIDGTERGP